MTAIYVLETQESWLFSWEAREQSVGGVSSSLSLKGWKLEVHSHEKPMPRLSSQTNSKLSFLQVFVLFKPLTN